MYTSCTDSVILHSACCQAGACSEHVLIKCGVGCARWHVVMETPEAPGGPSRRIRCLMSGPVADLWPRGRPNNATNARLVSHPHPTRKVRWNAVIVIWSRRRGSNRASSDTHSTTRCVAWIQSCGDADAGCRRRPIRLSPDNEYRVTGPGERTGSSN